MAGDMGLPAFHGDSRIIVVYFLALVCLAVCSPASAQNYYDGTQGQGYARSDRCARLEEELAQNWVRRNQPNTDLPRLREETREADRAFHSAQAKAERANCYEFAFIFGKQLRRTPRCLRLQRQIDKARRTLTRLKEQLDASSNTQSADSRRSDLIRALARNGCGSQYSREARRQSNNIFDNIFGGGFNNQRSFGGPSSSDFAPYATYRTMCVRMCDGYYYPVSYSALSSKFAEDSDQCINNCAAPAELFVYRNPGEAVEQMISLTGTPYSALPNAWRYRKEYVKGCSCNQAEFTPAPDVVGSADNNISQPSARQPQPQSPRVGQNGPSDDIIGVEDFNAER